MERQDAKLPTREEWDRIEAALPLTPEHRGLLTGIFTCFQKWEEWHQPPHVKVIALRRLARQVQDAGYWQSPELDALISQMDYNLPSDNKSKPANVRLKRTLDMLGDVYNAWSVREAGLSRIHGTTPSGPFFRFCAECLRAFVPELVPKTPEALASAISEAKARGFGGMEI